MKHRKAKSSEDIVRHFQKRCLERIGIILNQRVLKNLMDGHKLRCLEKQSNSKTVFKLEKERYDGKQMLQFDVVLVYDRLRHGFVTCWKYDSDYWFEHGCKKPNIFEKTVDNNRNV